ncbi:MAG: 50S ribosomal protein L25 [bacterium]|nr:50S ribosomal protein L25 [bacterium]MDZ4285120.1 50S ribosomal protein L25 [Patescibacteria group bacterium]
MGGLIHRIARVLKIGYDGSAMYTLTIQKRPELGRRAARLRSAGILPAVLYGKHEAATPISVVLRDFEQVWSAAGESGIVRLSGLEREKDTLIYAVDLDPVREVPRHADFYVIEKGQRVRVAIPLEFVGVAPAVRDLGGVLTKVLHELEVEAEPASLPHHLTVDISPIIALDQSISVRDIALPAGVSAIVDADEVVAIVSAAAEEAIEGVAPIDFAAIEVEKKGKEEALAEDAGEHK